MLEVSVLQTIDGTNAGRDKTDEISSSKFIEEERKGDIRYQVWGVTKAKKKNLEFFFMAPAPMSKEERAGYYSISTERELSGSEFERIWPHINNWWVSYGHSDKKNNMIKTFWFKCYLSDHHKSSEKKLPAEGEVIVRRNTKKKINVSCNAKLKVIKYFTNSELIRVTMQTFDDHQHDADVIDHLKITDAVRKIVEQEIQKPYKNPNIALALKSMEDEYTTASLVSSKYIANVRRSVVGLTPNPFIAFPDEPNVLNKEVESAVNFLSEKDMYHFEKGLNVDEVVALCFARKEMKNLFLKVYLKTLSLYLGT